MCKAKPISKNMKKKNKRGKMQNQDKNTTTQDDQCLPESNSTGETRQSMGKKIIIEEND